jgi:TolB-like protein
MAIFLRSPRLPALIGLVSAALFGQPAVAETVNKRLAVLEFKGKIEGDVLDALADAVRGGAVEGLTGRGIDVMTRENMMVLVREMGKKDCTEGDCEVETARNIGADFVVSGTVTRIEGTYVVTLKLHETKGGSLLGTEMVKGKSQLAVLDLLRGQGRDLVNAKLGRFPAAAAPSGTEKRIDVDSDFSTGAGERVVVKFESEPNGATLLVDGELLCKETPCSKSLVPGRHEVEMQKERYARAQLTVEAKKGSVVHMTLQANFATLVIRTEPANLPVAIDGKTQALSGGTLDVDPGQHEVLVNHRCYLPTGAQVVAKKGDRREIKLVGQPRLSAIAVTAEDAKGNEVEAKVIVDGIEVGTTPGTFKVNVCSQEVVVSSDKGSFRGQLKLVEKEVSKVDARFAAARVVAGIWVGEGKQESGSSWSIRLTLIPGSAVGERGADIDYPSLNCGGTLMRQAAPGPSLVFQEILKYGLDKCVNQGFVTLTYNPQSDTLQFAYHKGTGLDAWAVLRRAK